MIDVKLILDKINTRKITIAEIVRAITSLIENDQYQDAILVISRLKIFNSPKLWDAINTHLPAKLINDISQSLSSYGRALFSSRTMQEKHPNIVAALDSLVPATDIAPNITQKEPSHGISFELPIMNESVDELLDFEDLPERLELQPTTLRSSQLKEIISQFIFCLRLIKCC